MKNQAEQNAQPDFLLSMEKFFCLIFRLAGQIHAELSEGVGVHLRKNYGGMHLRISEARECCECF